MLVLMRVMNSTYFLWMRDCCGAAAAAAAVGVVVVGVVLVGFGLGAGSVGFWVVDAESPPAEVGGAGVICGEDTFGAGVCWGD